MLVFGQLHIISVRWNKLKTFLVGIANLPIEIEDARIVFAVMATNFSPMLNFGLWQRDRTAKHKTIVLTKVTVIERNKRCRRGLAYPIGFASVVVVKDALLVFAKAIGNRRIDVVVQHTVIADHKGFGICIFDLAA